MEYIITNGKISICLDEKGRPVTCGKKEAHSFSKEKAENILNSLPSVLKNFHFKIRCVSPGGSKKDTKNECNNHKADNCKGEKTVLYSEDYEPCKEVVKWMELSKSCDVLFSEARKRRSELHKKLSNVDKELSNAMHEIELEKWKSGSDGYKEYKKVKEVLQKRRKIKDELLVVQSIITNTKGSINLKNIEKTFEMLSTRHFTMRIIEEDNPFDGIED